MACLEPSVGSDGGSAMDAGPFVCGPMTCTGCCQGNVCLGGNHDDACGYDGRACKVCPARTACENPGACISVPGSNDAGAVVTVQEPVDLDRPTDPFSGQPLTDPQRPRCVWVFGFPVCS